MSAARQAAGGLWDAIKRYVGACGGDASKYVYGNTPRQRAIVDIEAVIERVYQAGIAEGRAQAKRERDAERLEYLATEFDR